MLQHHPFDLCRALPDNLLRVIFAILTEGPVFVMRRRLKLLAKWKAWKLELAEQEKALHRELEPGVESILRSKSLLLLERIAVDLDWPDVNIHRELRVFPVEQRPAPISVQELFQQAKYLRPTIWGSISNAESSEISRDITLEESLEKGWLEPLRSKEELDARFPLGWIPVRRFGIVQRNKLRPIDDLSENGVNSAYMVSDKLTLRTMDELVWACSTLMRFIRHKGDVGLQLSSGFVLSGRLHDFWVRAKGRSRPVVKTVDLKAAYKQLALNPCDRAVCVVTIRDPRSGDTKGMASRVVPFGGVASVSIFKRVARLLQRVLQEALVICFNYFDDYPILDVSALGSSTDKVVHHILDLLGFPCSADKEHEFSEVAELLGIRLDLTDVELSRVRVSNKPDKAAEVADAITKVLEAGKLEARVVPSLFGRIQFTEGQLMGRQGRLALADLRACVKVGGIVRLGPHAIDCFNNLKYRLTSGVPRTINACECDDVVYVFTDGACEPDGDAFRCTVGGVIYHKLNSVWQTRYFGCVLPSALVQEWSSTGKKHLIGPTELYAVALSRGLWRKFLDNRRVIFFVDHAGVLAACIKGSSRDQLWRRILLCLEASDATPALAWYTRVPSFSNCADPPSRGSGDFPVYGSLHRDNCHCIFSGTALSNH